MPGTVHDDKHPEWGWLRRPATMGALVFVFVISGLGAAGAAGYSWALGEDREADRDEALRTQTLSVCRSGGEFRILVAQSNDLLRRSAIGLVPGQKPQPRTVEFLESTQPAIDAFLSEAAGKPYRVRDSKDGAHGAGEVTPEVIEEVSKLNEARCQERQERLDELARQGSR